MTHKHHWIKRHYKRDNYETCHCGEWRFIMTRRYCSIPEVFNLRDWFTKNFNEPCRKHDYYYETTHYTRREADWKLVQHMTKAVRDKSLVSKVFVYYPTIALTYVSVRLMGWMDWGQQ